MFNDIINNDNDIFAKLSRDECFCFSFHHFTKHSI